MRAFSGEITTTILVPVLLRKRISAIIGAAWNISDFPYDVGRLIKTSRFENN
jgi:hypothetical protein